MNLKTNTRTFGKIARILISVRVLKLTTGVFENVENDKFCVFVAVPVVVYLFVCLCFGVYK